ncbi:alpha/beta hydrolase [Rathayibacter iranicus]|uniref:DUF1023 domain-containing protein n=2 Tax=Rathayibacter iranicus TaxID=59737 RepID=A0AAD1ADK0_9MICO|nr:alpha/beta hydrolase [Rathayibacter iranicus]AZZ56282.1 hypothetical protein C7V51_10615 [Rathayibacter iranicus]PPI45894.1 hypothetical protein C5E09_09600 [Rathayibacter iranicus]PPI59723.1 hypothetical protein C5E08_10525 [Rathayibacter iranicus]PPI70732.1 hypothetical protein C5E01_09565 [Rathayibacter iranicus]PWJ65181.1 alpha/beta hydrolase family protein [Rathayibacter iranicus NCPPB 2253 = VKM Ac-1602]
MHAVSVVVFDAEIAEKLCAQLRQAADVLEGQFASRSAMVEQAMIDFSGMYSRMFHDNFRDEVSDRHRLIGELREFAAQVTLIAGQAESENRRRRELAEWQEREDQRQRDSADPVLALAQSLDQFVDLRPSTEPIIPKPIMVSFAPRPRYRYCGGSPTRERSSADPERLRIFAGRVRTLVDEAVGPLVLLRSFWRYFVEDCWWARIEYAEVLPGFESFLAALVEDASWAERIATAFEQAGGAGLTNTALDARASSQAPPGVLRLLEPGLGPAEVAAEWSPMDLALEDIAALPLPTRLGLAGLNGLPAAVRDAASRSLLADAIADPARMRTSMGLTSPGGPSLEEFEHQVSSLAAGLASADARARRRGTVAQLVGFGSDDGMLTAAVSIGDLDTASTVLVNVPGAGTTLDGIGGNLDAANDLRSATMKEVGGPTAVVAWLGYRAPSFPEVPGIDRATSGAERFATFLDGLYDSRRDAPPDRVTVIAHSYGSTLVALAVQLTEHRIDDFVAYGSPGFQTGTEVADLNVDEVHATEVTADNTAIVGRLLSAPNRTDPRELSGVHVFSSEEGPGTRAVTTHDMTPDQSGGVVGYLSPDSTTMASIARIAVGGEP